MKTNKYVTYCTGILVAAVFYISQAHTAYAGPMDDKIDALIAGRIVADSFPFQSLAGLPPENRSEAVARIKDWIGHEREHALKTAQRRFKSNWPIPDTAREVCRPIESARQAEAALILVNASPDSDTYAELLQSANTHLEKREEKISQMMAAYTASAENDLETKFASLTGRDQGANFFRYGSGGDFADMPDPVRDYIYSIADYRYCVELNDALSFYKDFIDNHGWPKRSVYGKTIERNLFLVIQHATNEPRLVQDVLQKLALLAEKQETNPKFYPDLHDKISAHIGEPQLFGTFITCQNGRGQAYGGIKDPETIDMRRQKYGLRPYAERLKDIEASCKP